MATRYWVGGTGTWDASSTTHWSTSSGGSSGASAPTSADTVNFDSNSGTGTCTTASGAAASVVTLNSSNLALTLGANLTNSGTFTLTLGALSLGSYTLSCNVFSSNNSNTRSIAFGTGNVTLTGSNSTIWQTSTSTNFTYTGTPTVNSSYSGSTGTRTFAVGNGFTASNALNFNVTAGTDTIAFTNAYMNSLNLTGFSGTYSNTAKTLFGSLTLSSGATISSGTNATTFASTSSGNTITSAGKTQDYPIIFNGVEGVWSFQDALTQGSTRAFTFSNGTLQFKAGTTNTIGSFITSGTNIKYLQSTTAGTQATISQSSGTVNATYLTIQDLNVTGGALWNAFLIYNNVNAGNNTNWNFGNNFFFMFG